MDTVLKVIKAIFTKANKSSVKIKGNNIINIQGSNINVQEVEANSEIKDN